MMLCPRMKKSHVLWLERLRGNVSFVHIGKSAEKNTQSKGMPMFWSDSWCKFSCMATLVYFLAHLVAKH